MGQPGGGGGRLAVTGARRSNRLDLCHCPGGSSARARAALSRARAAALTPLPVGRSLSARRPASRHRVRPQRLQDSAALLSDGGPRAPRAACAAADLDEHGPPARLEHLIPSGRAKGQLLSPGSFAGTESSLSSGRYDWLIQLGCLHVWLQVWLDPGAFLADSLRISLPTS